MISDHEVIDDITLVEHGTFLGIINTVFPKDAEATMSDLLAINDPWEGDETHGV